MSKKTIVASGNIVSSTVSELKEAVREALNEEFESLVIDLDKTDMVDSTGIGILVATQNSLKTQSRSLELINVSQDILKMFQLMRLDRHFTIVGK